MNEEKMDELLRLMQAVVPDTSDMSDAGKVGFVYKFDYDPEVAYEKLDVVKFGTSLWTPKADTIGNPPPDQIQEGQENIQENDYWVLFLPGALGGDYIKKTDLAVAPTETDSGKAGIVKPDGKTIQVDADGLLTGTPLDFMGTWKGLQDAIESGEAKNGMVGYISGTGVDGEDENHPNNMLFDFDDFLSTISSNAVQNKVVAAAIDGLANAIKKVEPDFYFSKSSDNIANISFFEVTLAKIGNAGICSFSINNAPNEIPDNTEVFEFPDGFKPGQMVYRWVPCIRNNSTEGVSQLLLTGGKILVTDNGKTSTGISGTFLYLIA